MIIAAWLVAARVEVFNTTPRTDVSAAFNTSTVNTRRRASTAVTDPLKVDRTTRYSTRSAGRQEGFNVGSPGDVNGDGNPDLLVASFKQWSGGPMNILFLKNDNSVLSSKALSRNGWSCAGLGDLDGDTIPDVAIGSIYDDGNKGAAYILFLRADGSTKSERTIRFGSNGFTSTQAGGGR